MGKDRAGVTVKIMPDGADVDFTKLRERAEACVRDTYGDVGEVRLEEEPIAFGLKALKVTFIIDEDFGTDEIEEKMSKLENVASAQVIQFARLT